jgi:hypothetical protein
MGCSVGGAPGNRCFYPDFSANLKNSTKSEVSTGTVGHVILPSTPLATELKVQG